MTSPCGDSSAVFDMANFALTGYSNHMDRVGRVVVGDGSILRGVGRFEGW